MQPVNPLFEKGVAAGHRLVVAPVARGLEPLGDRREVPKDHVADNAISEQLPKLHRLRFVVIVFADDDDSVGLVARGHRGFEIDQAREGRFLDQHVLPRGERAKRQVEVEARRDGDEHRIDTRVLDGGLITLVRRLAFPLTAERVGPGLVPARVAADDVAPESFEMATVNLGDEAAAKKGQA